jgi:hypothetical protein
MMHVLMMPASSALMLQQEMQRSYPSAFYVYVIRKSQQVMECLREHDAKRQVSPECHAALKKREVRCHL